MVKNALDADEVRIKMKIYKLDAELNEYESFRLLNEDNIFIRNFRKEMSNGERKNGKFDNLELELIDSGKPSDLPQFWNFTGALIFSERAKNCLESYLEDCVEFILLKYHEVSYYLVNVIRIIDGIDYENAGFRKLDTGLVVGMDKYSFKENEVKNVNMFKVLLNKRIYNSEIYVSSELKERIEEFKLVGFKLTEMWDLDK